MQKLHLVGITTDRDGLILSARRGARSGAYVLPADDALLALVAELQEQRAAEADAPAAEAEAPARAPKVESSLSVREVQARLRQGRSVAEVAREAGVPEDWVERFAGPVVAERAQAAQRLQSCILTRQRLGPSRLPIGEAVRRHLADRGVAMSPEERAQAWTAEQISEGRWSVRFTYRYRGAQRTLRYELDDETGEAKAADRQSAELGYVAPDPSVPKPRRAAAPAPEPAPEPAVTEDAPAPAPKRRRATSPAARERARAASAMEKDAARRASDAERALQRRARERRAAEEAAARAARAQERAERAAAREAERTRAAREAEQAEQAEEARARSARATSRPRKGEGSSPRSGASSRSTASRPAPRVVEAPERPAPVVKPPPGRRGTSAGERTPSRRGREPMVARPAPAPVQARAAAPAPERAAPRPDEAAPSARASQEAGTRRTAPAAPTSPAAPAPRPAAPGGPRTPTTPTPRSSAPAPSATTPSVRVVPATPTTPRSATTASSAEAPAAARPTAARPAAQTNGSHPHEPSGTERAIRPQFRAGLVEPAGEATGRPAEREGGAPAAPARPRRRTRPLRAT